MITGQFRLFWWS